MCLSTILSFQCVFSCVNRIDIFLVAKFVCYVKITAFGLVELLHNCAKGVLDASYNSCTKPGMLNMGPLDAQK